MLLVGSGSVWTCHRLDDNMTFASWVDAKAVSPDGSTAAYVVCLDGCDVPEMKSVVIIPARNAEEEVEASTGEPLHLVDVSHDDAGPRFVSAPDMQVQLRWTGAESVSVAVSCLQGALPAPARFRNILVEFAGPPSGLACREQIS